MPKVLQFELVPCRDLWVDVLPQLCLDKRDIGLYFFPRNKERLENYVTLLQFMESGDLAMITRVEGVELLIFMSKLLRDCQIWNGRHFLWRLFKKETKHASQVKAHKCDTESDSTEVEMDIDIIGGKDVAGRRDVVIRKGSIQLTLPDMTMDMEINAGGGKDARKTDIDLSKESVLLPPPDVKTEPLFPLVLKILIVRDFRTLGPFLDNLGQGRFKDC